MLIHGPGHITKVERFMEFGIKHAKTLQTLGHFFLSENPVGIDGY